MAISHVQRRLPAHHPRDINGRCPTGRHSLRKLDIKMIFGMPELNATLNSISAALLVLGYTFIRRRSVGAHKFCMLGATATSCLFLISYLYYHYHHGSTRFPGQGGWRTLYFSILIPHTILAAVQAPLIYKTIRYAFAGRYEAHRRLARITLPIWLYVSITGVIVYCMLYRINWS